MSVDGDIAHLTHLDAGKIICRIQDPNDHDGDMISANTDGGIIRRVPTAVLRRRLATISVVACATVAIGCGGQAATRVSMPPDVWGGVYTEAQAKRGEDVYYEHCIECHAQDLSGAASYEQAPPLKGDAFHTKWEQKTVAELFNLARTEMPKKKPATLKPTEYADALAFIFQQNGFPAGQNEMPPDAGVLQRVKIVGHH